jgi:hypothetical protein
MEIVLVIIGVAIFIRVWLSQLGLHKQADKHHKEVVNKFDSLHNVVSRFDSGLFTPPFRLGRKQKRAILDAKGREVIIMPHNSEKQAQMYCDYLNGL